MIIKERRYIPENHEAQVGLKKLRNDRVAPTTKSKTKKPETIFMLWSITAYQLQNKSQVDNVLKVKLL